MLRPALAIALLTFTACYASPVSTAGEDVVLRAGTSFGHCLGYCETAMAFSPDEVTLTRTSREPDRNPPQTQRLPLPAAEYREILDRLDPAAFLELQDVYGCPDCADGGAEWIEVETGGKRKRVTFEYGSNVAQIAPLIARIRAVRERFEPAPAGG